MTKAFAATKEQLACDVPSVAEAAGAAMCAEVYQIPRPRGRNLEARDAARIAANVSLGKKAILFRLGNDPREHAGAVSELAVMLKKAETKGGGAAVRFPMNICSCIARVALEELTIDMCLSCWGAGQVRDHDLQIEGRQPMKVCPTCMGQLRRRYTDDDRVIHLAQAWIGVFPAQPLDDPAAVTIVAASLRRHSKLRQLLEAVDFARGVLIEAEKITVEETAGMLERW